MQRIVSLSFTQDMSKKSLRIQELVHLRNLLTTFIHVHDIYILCCISFLVRLLVSNGLEVECRSKPHRHRLGLNIDDGFIYLEGALVDYWGKCLQSFDVLSLVKSSVETVRDGFVWMEVMYTVRGSILERLFWVPWIWAGVCEGVCSC